MSSFSMRYRRRRLRLAPTAGMAAASPRWCTERRATDELKFIHAQAFVIDHNFHAGSMRSLEDLQRRAGHRGALRENERPSVEATSNATHSERSLGNTT